MGKVRRTYLKLGHLILNSLLSSDNRNTAIFDTIAYVLLTSSPIKTLVRTLEVRLLQKVVIKILAEKLLHKVIYK